MLNSDEIKTLLSDFKYHKCIKVICKYNNKVVRNPSIASKCNCHKDLAQKRQLFKDLFLYMHDKYNCLFQDSVAFRKEQRRLWKWDGDFFDSKWILDLCAYFNCCLKKWKTIYSCQGHADRHWDYHDFPIDDSTRKKCKLVPTMPWIQFGLITVWDSLRSSTDERRLIERDKSL